MARRGGFKPKREPAKVEWERMELVEKLVQEVIDQHHKHLERAKIVVLGKPRASSKNFGCGGVAKLRKPSKALLAMIKEDVGDVHYIVELGLSGWEKLSTEARTRLLDHMMCHAGGLDDRGRWFTVDHDVEEFTNIIHRHGLDQSPGLVKFVHVARQLELKLKIAGVAE